MTKICVVFALILFAASLALGQSSSPSLDEMQKSVAEAYKSKTMHSLGQNLIQGSVIVRIVHSLGEGKGSVVTRRFKTFAQLDGWLKKGEREEGAPFRQVSEIVKCAKGHCAYNYDGGILHNQLYLHDIYYRYRHGKPYITRIDLLDGD